MNLKQVPIRPFHEGIIRIKTSNDPMAEVVVFHHEFEVLARHHQPPAHANETPRMAEHFGAQRVLKQRAVNTEAGKIVEVPIKMYFNKADNALRAQYQAYNELGQCVCKGDGYRAQRMQLTPGNEETLNGEAVALTVPCAGAQRCQFGSLAGVTCRLQVSLTCQIPGQENPMSVFEARTSSYNAYRTLKGQLYAAEQRFGGLRHVPFKLQLWQASNKASDYASFDVFKLALDAASERDAIRAARIVREEEQQAGLNPDVDSIAGPDDDPLDLDAESNDYVLIRDFYRPMHRADEPESESGDAQASHGPRRTLADDVIAKALATAKQRAPEGINEPGERT